MTTPTTFNSAQRIIANAMKNCGYLPAGEDPTSEQFADYMNRLNDYLNFLQTQGLKLWLQTEVNVPLIAGKAMYALKPGGDVDMTKPTRVISAYYLDSSNNQRPLLPLAWDDYERLSNKQSPGQINSYFVDKQAYSLNVTFWLTPDAVAATGIVVLLLQRQIQNIVNIVTDLIDLPVEWLTGIGWMFADEICTGQPQAIMDRCMQKAAVYRGLLEDWDVEDASTNFSPDSRMSWGSGRFT